MSNADVPQGFRRLHPLTMLYGVITSLPGALFSLYLALNNPGEFIYIAIAVFFGLTSMPFVVLRWFYFQFEISAQAVTIHSGVLSRQQRSIAIGKIQNVEIRQNFLQRLLGLAQVAIETASSAREAEGALNYVSVQEAEHIRGVLQALRDGGTPAIAAAETTELPLFAMQPRDVVISGALRFSPVIFAVAFSASQYWQMYSGEDAFDLIYGQFGQMESWQVALMFAAFGIGAIIVSWIGGIILNFNRFYGFSIELRGNKLYKQHGLFARWKGTIPLPKIQMLRISANPLMRMFGMARLEVQTAGFGSEKSGAEIAVPMANREAVAALGASIMNFSLPETFSPLSPLAVRRAAIRYALMLLIPALPAGWLLTSYIYWLLVLLPLAWLASLLRFRWRGYALDAFGNIIVKSGWLNNRIAVIPASKVQALVVESTFFQRRLGLATVIFDTAATAGLRDAAIVDLATDDALRLAADVEKLLSAKHAGNRGNGYNA